VVSCRFSPRNRWFEGEKWQATKGEGCANPPRLMATSPVESAAMTDRTSTEPSVFTRVLRGEIPGEIVLSTDDVFVLQDIAPKAPLHLLVIPKTDAYRDVTELAEGDPKLLAHMVQVARTVATQAGYDSFRLVFNTGLGAGQTVFHVHAHVLGGDASEDTMTAGMAGEGRDA
jgi:histidine triad (HIT) family protein